MRQPHARPVQAPENKAHASHQSPRFATAFHYASDYACANGYLRGLDEELVVPLADGIEFFVAEKRDDLVSPAPIWMIEILLSDYENDWARPGFPVRDLSE